MRKKGLLKIYLIKLVLYLSPDCPIDYIRVNKNHISRTKVHISNSS